MEIYFAINLYFLQNGYTLPNPQVGNNLSFTQDILPSLVGTSYYLSKITKDMKPKDIQFKAG